MDLASVSGWVVTSEGEPVAETEVSLVALTERDLQWEQAWREGEWGELDSPTDATESGAGGQFRFESWPGLEEGGEYVLCATLRGFETTFARGSYAPGVSEPVRLVLRAAAPIEVVVLDEEDEPVAGANVEQYGLASGRDPGIARRFAHHSSETDQGGITRLPHLAGEQVLVAGLGSRRSLPWRGVPNARVVLRLLPGFQVGGVVTLPDWSALEYEGERRIRISARVGDLERNLVTLRHVEAGEWGPVALPIVPEAQYTVHLEGSPIIPVRTSFVAPAAGSSVAVNLDAELGSPLWVLVTDMEENPIADSEVTLKWELEGAPNQLTRRAQDDGFVNLWSIPPVEFRIVASAPGYATRELAGKTIPPSDEYLPIPLLPAGKVTGHCYFHGDPVEDFTVVAYESSSTLLSKAQFHGREDGSFVIEDAPLGDIFVLASTDRLPPSEPVAVTVPETGQAQVRIDLEEGRKRRGRVLDGESGAPIAGALLRKSLVQDSQVEQWSGLGITTDGNGEFELDPLSKGLTVVEVSAPGYASNSFQVRAGPGEEQAPIHLELERPVPLRLQLVGLPPGSYSGFEASGVSPGHTLPIETFDADGRLEYRAVNPGYYRVDIVDNSGVRPNAKLSVDLAVRSRRESVARIQVGGANHLTVALDLDTIEEPKTGLWARIQTRSSTGEDMMLLGSLSDEGVYQVDGVAGSSVWVEVFRANGDALAADQGRFEGSNLTMHLEGGHAPMQLRVTDDDGAALSGVGVMTLDPATGSFGAFGTTGADGSCTLFGLPAGEVLVNLDSRTHGLLVGARIDGGDSEAELVLPGGSSLRLRVQHDGAPISGATGNFWVAGNRAYYSDRTSDSDGRLSWENLSPGSYHVSISHPAYWREERDFPASEDPKEVAVELRKLGAVTVRLVALEGAALSGEQVHLVDLATGEEVDAWLAEGRVTATGPATDARGEVTFGGIPEGDYRVRDVRGEKLGTVSVRGEGTDLEVLRLNRQ